MLFIKRAPQKNNPLRIQTTTAETSIMSAVAFLQEEPLATVLMFVYCVCVWDALLAYQAVS